MFEYIKRVSIAISFMAQKVSVDGGKVKEAMESLSFELLMTAQKFRGTDFKLQDLRRLEDKILYLIDILDYGRINGLVSEMNAKVFVDSMVSFLKHVGHLIEQKSVPMPIFQLKELDEIFARKNAKDSAKNKLSENFSFSNLTQKSADNFDIKNEPKIESKVEVVDDNKSLPREEILEVETPKKILEESILYPAPVFNNFDKDKEDRRVRILKSLTLGGASIKEIASKLSDVGEKTIQRDLLELMRDKKVIMLGKKRWAKYYLK